MSNVHILRNPNPKTSSPTRHSEASDRSDGSAMTSQVERGLPSRATLRSPSRPRLRAVENIERISVKRTLEVSESGLSWAKKYRNRLRLTDVGIISGALATGFFVPLGAINTQFFASWTPVQYSVICALTIIVWSTFLAVFHSRSSRVVGVGVAEYKQVTSASAVTFGLLAIAFMILDISIPRGYFVLAFPLGIAGLILGRWLWRKWLIWQRQFDHYLSRVVVVGNRDDVQYVLGQIHKRSGAAYTVVGTVLDKEPPHTSEHRFGDIPISYGLDHVAGITAALGADAVIVASHPSAGTDFIQELAWKLEGTATELILASQLVDVAGPRIHFRPVDGLPLIHVEIPNFEGGKHVLKRALDIVASGLALVLLMPLLTVLAILIRLDSPGPALFKQERVGRDGRTFRILKFRSMVETATDDLEGLLDKNEGCGVLFKIKNDPRVTRVGKMLRKYSLDELPQLWNILKGDMSLVGPRPPLQQEVDRYEKHVNRRLYIKPGLTGMWQVNGRSDLSWQESVRLDLYYVENWSLIGDIVILWRTLRVITHPVGAY